MPLAAWIPRAWSAWSGNRSVIVSAGWNTDYGKDKFSVTVTEEDDLVSILIEAGLLPEARSALTNAQKFALLKTEAEIFAMQAAAEHGAIKPEKADAQLVALRARRQQYLAHLVAMRDAAASDPE
jgi:hypothetical protein